MGFLDWWIALFVLLCGPLIVSRFSVFFVFVNFLRGVRIFLGQHVRREYFGGRGHMGGLKGKISNGDLAATATRTRYQARDERDLFGRAVGGGGGGRLDVA